MISRRGWRRGIIAGTSVALLVGICGCSGGGVLPPGRGSMSGSPSAPVPSTPHSPSASATPSKSPSPTPSPVRPAEVTQRKPGWALDRIDQRRLPLDGRFTTAGQGEGVTVYVVDGLFDVNNAEFGGRGSVGRATGETCVLEDGINHGLFVAGLVAGRRTGVAKQAKIVSVGSSYGCEGGDGGATDAQKIARIVRALDWVARNADQPAVVNLSLNMDTPSPTFTTAVERLIEADITVVASAGNDGEDACQHPPAGLPGVITVGASTKADKDAGLNHGRCVDLFAPAEEVRSVVDPHLSPNRLATNVGAATSWAAPLVSGAAALYLSVHQTASPAEVRAWLLDNTTHDALRGNLHGSPDRLLFTGGPL